MNKFINQIHELALRLIHDVHVQSFQRKLEKANVKAVH